MKKAFKISTNIERDSSIDIDYIVTKNTNDVFDKIMFSHGKGQNSFTIIGSYGTGKSSFLWAIEKHLSGSPKFNVESSE
jgi:ABC-type transporter Mla maintaining outer membrane lipid asymmetry ATPase subunit MlaF